MPTKTEYREYIAGEQWRARRRAYLGDHGQRCNRCKLPRSLVVLVYDQDMHVHHKSYARVGAETDDDLEALCRRCHEIETFGSSSLHQPKSSDCVRCGRQHWNPSFGTFLDDLCGKCLVVEALCDGACWYPIAGLTSDGRNGQPRWKGLLEFVVEALIEGWDINEVRPTEAFRRTSNAIIEYLAEQEIICSERDRLTWGR